MTGGGSDDVRVTCWGSEVGLDGLVKELLVAGIVPWSIIVPLTVLMQKAMIFLWISSPI